MTNFFSRPELARQIAAALADTPLPDGHDSAIIGGVDTTGAQIVLVAKISVKTGALKISGIARHEWSGDNQVGASVLYSWKT